MLSVSSRHLFTPGAAAAVAASLAIAGCAADPSVGVQHQAVSPSQELCDWLEHTSADALTYLCDQWAMNPDLCESDDVDPEFCGWLAAYPDLCPARDDYLQACVAVPQGEKCDGLDNDGDGAIDEDFDVNGDGVVHCCAPREFFVTSNPTNNQFIDAYLYNAPGNYTYDPAVAGGLPSGEPVSYNSVGDFDNDGTLDILWRGTTSLERYLTHCEVPVGASEGEWTTVPTGLWQAAPTFIDGAYQAGGDVDNDGDLDVVGWRVTRGSNGLFNSAIGFTALNNGNGSFTELATTFNATAQLSGNWAASYTYNVRDVDGDARPDLVINVHANGGSATTEAYYLPGFGNGFFGAAVTMPTAPGEPQNFGDLGDIDGDSCVDFLGGSDDDGNRGVVLAWRGHCNGTFDPPYEVVDNCVGCSGSGTGHGNGKSRLHDWDKDGLPDLLTSQVINTGSASEIYAWPPLPLVPPALTVPLSTVVTTATQRASDGFATPLHAVERCDGIDNDGDGQIDEGFDLDGDGVARCCDSRDFFAARNASGVDLDVHMYDTPGVFDHVPAITGVGLAGNAAINAVGHFDQTNGQNLDIVWWDTGNGRRYVTSCRPVAQGNQGEWITQPRGAWNFWPWLFPSGGFVSYTSAGHVNADDCVDLVGWDLQNGAVNGSGQGFTALGNCDGTFNEMPGTFDASVLLGNWIAQRVYNLRDVDGDGMTDAVIYAYSSGGASDTDAFYLRGDCSGKFGPPMPIFTATGQPQNFGDLGDIDGDGCMDWVGGSDDDGNKGVVLASYGDCAGNFSPPTTLVDNCVGCSGSGVSHGSGQSQLYDWDGNGTLDLLSSQWRNTGTTADIYHWVDAVGPQLTAAATPDIASPGFVSPIRPGLCIP